MKTIAEEILEEFKAFEQRTGCKPWRVGRAVCNDATLISRIKDDCNIGIQTVDKIRSFMVAFEENNTAPMGCGESKK